MADTFYRQLIAQTYEYSLRISTTVSLIDIDKAAGVSPSTGSRAIIGMAVGNLISPTTQSQKSHDETFS